MQREMLLQYLDETLASQQISDYCPNGLQVQGKAEIKTLVTGVTACLALLKAAVAHSADAILVHHGYFWRDEPACIVGQKHARLHCLLQNNINLFAYHLPLDKHAQLGNNAQLARVLAIQDAEPLPAPSSGLVWHGHLQTPSTPAKLLEHIEQCLQRRPLHIADNSASISRIAWCTGAAHSLLHEAIAAGVDAYITGEIAEHSVHLAREAGIHLFAAGHYATERYGVQALGEHLAQRFHLKHIFIEVDNPV